MLSDLRDKMAKSFTIQVPLQSLNDEFVQNLEELIALTVVEDQQANCQLKFKILDMQDELAIEMPAKQIKINLTNEFLEGLEELEYVKYKLN